MSKANKMFKDLDYLDRESFENDDCIVFRKDSRKCLGKSIEFHKPTKTVEVGGIISMQELKAINEKVKELGWLDVK